MNGKKKRRNESSHAKTLVRSLAQRKDAPDKQGDADYHQDNSGPARLNPEPEPIALRMNRAGDDQRQRDQPKDPAFSSLPDILLSAGEDDDGGQSEKVRGLVPIRERPESTFVMPERQCGVAGAKRNAERGETGNAKSEDSQLG